MRHKIQPDTIMPGPTQFTRRQLMQLNGAGFSAAALAACAPAAAPTGDTAAPAADAPAADAGAAPQTGGTMVWVGHQEVAGLSPSDAGPTVHWAMISNIHNAMLQINTANEL